MTKSFHVCIPHSHRHQTSCALKESEDGAHQRSRSYLLHQTFAAMQMIEAQAPTIDGCELLLSRCTEPEPELIRSLTKPQLALPA